MAYREHIRYKSRKEIEKLREAGRLVRPGGMLVTDHDPQRSGWDYRGVARLRRGGVGAFVDEVRHRFGDLLDDESLEGRRFQT